MQEQQEQETVEEIYFTKRVDSAVDNASKFVFKTSTKDLIEFNYIDNGSSKDIICSATQTSCKQGCVFCFLTALNLPVRHLTSDQIVYGVSNVIRHCRNKDNNTLLISFMGAGEPLINKDNVIKAAKIIHSLYKNKYETVRFAIATIMPSAKLMKEFTKQVKESGLNFKVHLSLHSTSDNSQKEIMPKAGNIRESIDLLINYSLETDNETEIHYTLIKDVNDTDADIVRLVNLFRETGITIKFLDFVESGELRASSRVLLFREHLKLAGIKTEFYIPPGRDIGTSCGQFLIDEKV